MSKKEIEQKQDEVILDVGSTLTKAEAFIEKNKKAITYTLSGIVVGVAAYFAFTYLYLEPLEKEAQIELYKAQENIDRDSLRLALNGDGSSMGLLQIADEYAWTKAGNLARYYAGVCYLQLGEYEDAIRQMDKFSTNDPVFEVLANGVIADAFLEIGQPKEALEYYDKAVRSSNNEFVVPFYLKKAGMLAEDQKNWKDARKYFERLKNEFPKSQHALDVDKFLARIEAKLSQKN
ncbi:MAG: tetratricopeptide repeat protein [Thermaurantimonas sp.]|uniref:tetratricopeptide repeat protein n=1 Tax=Thermaurantimonas sp. TaxID=2681568 RepID=UPI00391CBC54